jgi:hypothetical protein
MIIVKLIGGLGNQLFQYAAGRRLAEKHSTILKLDVTGFEKYKLHRYCLHYFHVWEYVATQAEIDTIQFNWFNRLQNRLNSSSGKEKHLHFDPKILDAPNNILLFGYWASEKYFADITDILRRELVVKHQQDAQSQMFSDRMQSTESVSLHVRRGDYVQNPVTNKFHGTCNQDYYDCAVRYIAERVINPHFFIFSDEPEWVKENLKIDFPMTVVDCNDASRNYEDLRLMSTCKHNIIANSSFSWWGAWLNPNPHKVVIAPKKWFNEAKINTKDLIPESWIKL